MIPLFSDWLKSKKLTQTQQSIVLALKGLTCFLLLILLVALEENWRGKRAWVQFQTRKAATGATPKSYTHFSPPVPNNRNFAMTPLLAPLADQIMDPTNMETWPAKLRNINSLSTALAALPSLYISETTWQGGVKTEIDEFYVNIFFDKNSENTGKTQASFAANEILAWLETFQALEELEEASKRPFVRFNIKHAALNGPITPHRAVLLKAAEAYFLRAMANLSLKNTQLALKDFQLILYLSSACRKDNLIHSHKSAQLILQFAIHLIWHGLHEHVWQVEDLKHIEAQLTSIDWLDSLNKALRGEMAANNAFFEAAINRGNGISIIRWKNAIRSEGSLRFNQLRVNQLFIEHIFSVVDVKSIRVYPAYAKKSTQIILGLLEEDWRPHNHYTAHLVCNWGFIYLDDIVKSTAIAHTSTQMALISCALERFAIHTGSYPTKLINLFPNFILSIPTDAIDGNSLRYIRHNPTSYRLWSIGWDEKDNGGQTTEFYDLSNWKDWVWMIN